MDIAKDSVRLVKHVAHVPGLSIVFTLAMQIMRMVQISKWNTATLQYLAHVIGEYLIDIAEHMQGKWDHAPPTLKTKLDEFEVLLRDIQKAVKRQTYSSRMMALVNASDRQNHIAMLQSRLSDLQRSILVLLGIDASLALENISRAVTSQDALAHATHNRVMHIEEMVQDRFPQATTLQYDTGLRSYTRADIQVLRTINQHIRLDSDAETVTVLHEAERCDDGKVVFVRSYQGAHRQSIKDAFEEDLTLRRHSLTPSILQVIGASPPTSSLLIQVYHAPRGVLGTFKQWFRRTLSDNPLELIVALFNMQSSFLEFATFQKMTGIRPASSDRADEFIVTKSSSLSQHEWSIVYTGEIRQDKYDFWPVYECHIIRQTMTELNPLSREDPTHELIFHPLDALMDGPYYNRRGTPSFEEIFQCAYQNSDLRMLRDMLVENGWIRSRDRWIKPTCYNIGLGDIGYMNEGDEFVTVDNVRNLLVSTSDSRGGMYYPEERYRSYVDKWSSYSSKPPPTVIYEKYRSCWRGRVQHESGFINSWYKYGLHSFRLEEDIAIQGKLFRERACTIIAQHGLSVPPHALMLVLAATSSAFKLNGIDEDGSYEHADDEELDIPETELSDDHRSQTSGTQLCIPDLFVFTETQGDPLHIRDCGTPELVPFRMSLEPEPAWLDKPGWAIESEIYEEKGGFSLTRPRGFGYNIEYIQLPPGTAAPYITEV